MKSGAKFNSDRTRRRLLWRWWSTNPVGDGSWAMFNCLNPSTADEETNDHSVTKMIGFSQRLGCHGLLVTNLFDICTTYPTELYDRDLPALNSRANDAAILAAAAKAKIIICAWGGHGLLFERGRAVLDLLRPRSKLKLHALKLNADGTPAHPLRLPYSLRPIRYGEKHDR